MQEIGKERHKMGKVEQSERGEREDKHECNLIIRVSFLNIMK
jgi:hypothetical protein